MPYCGLIPCTGRGRRRIWNNSGWRCCALLEEPERASGFLLGYATGQRGEWGDGKGCCHTPGTTQKEKVHLSPPKKEVPLKVP